MALSRIRKVYFSAVGIGLAGTFAYLSVRNLIHPPPSPELPAPEPVALLPYQEVLQAIERYMAVPAGTPSVEEIKDPELLRAIHPSFYGQARAGDWVVRYATLAILYRLSDDKIIAVLPVQAK